jgi:hypothetical protein
MRPPVLPPGVSQQFVPIAVAEPGAPLEYRPMLLAAADIRFADRKLGIDLWEERSYLAPISDGQRPIDWDRAQSLSAPPIVDSAPHDAAQFAPLPTSAAKVSSYKSWRTDFAKWLHRNTVLTANQISREVREAVVAGIRAEYQPKVDRATEKIRNLRQQVEAELDRKRAEQMDAVISVVGALFGRKRRSSSRRSSSRSRSRQTAAHAQEDLDAAVAALDRLRRQIEKKIGDLDFELRPTKSNIDVREVSLVWVPYWRRQADSVSGLR